MNETKSKIEEIRRYKAVFGNLSRLSSELRECYTLEVNLGNLTSREQAQVKEVERLIQAEARAIGARVTFQKDPRGASVQIYFDDPREFVSF